MGNAAADRAAKDALPPKPDAPPSENPASPADTFNVYQHELDYIVTINETDTESPDTHTLHGKIAQREASWPTHFHARSSKSSRTHENLAIILPQALSASSSMSLIRLIPALLITRPRETAQIAAFAPLQAPYIVSLPALR
jgi:hypothetical protein